MEYNIHQDDLWHETGEIIGAYVNELAKANTHPSSFLVIPTRIPFNSQKVHYREKLIEGLNAVLDGACGDHSYQISFWASFSWRMKLPIQADGATRTCYLYGDNVNRRLLFEDRPNPSITMIEEVFMNQVYRLPIERIESIDFVDRFSDGLLEPLAEKTITIDHVHRYTDNRIRFDLIFDAMRYHLIVSIRTLDGRGTFPEATIFISD
jgi:hypothetical protein